MKNTIIAILLALFQTHLLYGYDHISKVSQMSNANKNDSPVIKHFIFGIGPVLGLNFGANSLNGYSKTIDLGNNEKEKITANTHVDYRFGVCFDTRLSHNFYFQTSILYSKQRVDLNNTIDYYYLSYPQNPNALIQHYDLRSIEIPCYFILKKHAAGVIRFSIGVGPYLAINVHASLITDPSKTAIGIPIGDEDAVVKRSYYGMSAFAGIILSNKFHARLEFWSGSEKAKLDGSFNGISIQHSAFCLTTAYLFKVKIRNKGIQPHLSDDSD